LQMAERSNTGEVEIDASTRLAFQRTRIAYERTMLSWVRTATSLITFGFSVYKFFQIETPSRRGAGRLVGPREFAMILVGIGLVSLALATLEYR
jgi:putative membrane protein